MVLNKTAEKMEAETVTTTMGLAALCCVVQLLEQENHNLAEEEATTGIEDFPPSAVR